MKVKQSAGRASRLLSDSNRRYFTLDFPDQLLYYANSDVSPQISRPIRFQDITKVESISQCPESWEQGYSQAGQQEESPPMLRRSNSSSSISSRRSFSSLTGLGRKSLLERHGFVVHYSQSSRDHRMELQCSKEEATQWIAALNVAVCLGCRRASVKDIASNGTEDLSTEAGSGRDGSRSSSPTAQTSPSVGASGMRQGYHH